MPIITPLALGLLLFMPLASAQITPATIPVETMPEPGTNCFVSRTGALFTGTVR